MYTKLRIGQNYRLKYDDRNISILKQDQKLRFEPNREIKMSIKKY